MFWGITLDAGKRYTQTVEQSFHLSMAALGFQNSSALPVTIMAEVEKAQYALCTLKPGSIPQQALDYTFTEGEEITFFTEGQGEVHLTGYLIEEVEPVDFEGENGKFSESEEESESQSAGSESDSNEESKSSSGEEVTLQDLLLGIKEEEEVSHDDSEDDDDWDPSKSNPTSKKKKKDIKKKKRKGLRNNETDEVGEPASGLFAQLSNNRSSEDEKDEASEPVKKTKGKKRKAKKSKTKLDKNGENVKEESTADIHDERPKKKAKKSKGSMTSSASDVMHINVNESRRTVKPDDAPNSSPSDSTNASQNVQSPNKDKSLSTATDSKSDGREQDKSPNVSPTKKTSAQLVKKTLPGGVVIEDLRKGTGQVAKNGQRVSLLYRGVLAKNKKQFDANLNRKSPFAFVLGKGEVIRGWDLGVAGMQVGGKRKLVIPPSQGYGNQRMGPIPPQSTLEFEVELVCTK